MSSVDPHDIPPGAAQTQINFQCLKPGALTVRKGIQKNTNFSGSTSNDIISQFTYQHPLGDFIVTLDTNGDIKSRKGGTVTTLASGVSTSLPYYFSRARNGDLIGTNGLERGIRWDGITSAAEELGITAPASAPTPAEDTGGGSLTNGGTYVCYYRYVDNTVPTPVPSSMSPGGSVSITTASSRIDWTITTPSEDRVSHIELWRSLPGAPNRLYYIATIADGTTTYPDDGTSDATLIANAAADSTLYIDLLLPNGEVNARRFTPPPTNKAVPVWFQDRMHYLGETPYETGTVTTNGSTTITGSGTSWTSDMAGRYIWIEGETAPLLISSASATSITTSTAASSSASGKTYGLVGSSSDRNSFYFSSPDEPEAVLATNLITPQENTGDNDDIVGGFAFGSVMYVAKERHIYAYSFVRQPVIDGDVRLIADRGLVNNRTVAVYEGAAFCMDRLGIYMMSLSGQVQPISQQIQDYFRPDETPIDWANAKWFHAAIDPQHELVKFFVGFTADSSTRPQRALVYNIRLGVWWVETYIDEIGGASLVEISGERRLMLGGQDDRIYTANEGETDCVSTATTGTATGSTSTTLTDSTASFGTSSELVGAPVAIIDGTGKAQIRRVSSHTNTALTVSSAWSTNPASGDGYVVGAVEYQWKGKVHRVAKVDNQNKRTIVPVVRVASSAAYMDVRRYLNRSATAANWYGNTHSTAAGEGVAHTQGEPDAVVDLTQPRGYTTVDFSGVNLGGFKSAGLFVEIELRGYKSEKHEVYRLELEGFV